MVNNIKFSVIVTIVFLMISSVLLLVIDEKGAHFWISYLFVIIAVGMVTASSFVVGNTKKKNYMVDGNFITISIIYLISEIIISLIFGLFIKIDILYYLAIQIVALSIILIIGIFISMSRDTIQSQENAIKVNRNKSYFTIEDLEEIRVKVKNIPEDIRYKAIDEVEKVIEKLKYSDPIIHESLEGISREIQGEISKLKIEVDGIINKKVMGLDIFSEIISNITELIDKRNNRNKLLK